MRTGRTGLALAVWIVERVSKGTGIPEAAMTGRSREEKVVEARTMALTLIHRFTGLDMTEVAACLKRTRTQTHEALSRHINLCKEKAYQKVFEKIRKELT